MAVFIRDDFVDANGTALQSHAATWAGGSGLGAWTKLGTADATIQSNRLVGNTSSGTRYVNTVATSGNNAELALSVRFVATGKDVYVILRRDGSGAGYAVYVQWSGLVRLVYMVADGPNTVLDSWTHGWSVGTDHNLLFTANGSAFAVTVDGTPRLSATNTWHTTGTGVVVLSDSGVSEGYLVNSIEVADIGETGGGGGGIFPPWFL